MGRSDGGLGERELGLLRWVAERGAVTVGEAAEQYGSENGLARTTVQTMLERLWRKRRLRRRQLDGVYRYSSSVPAQEVLSDAVRAFVDGPLAGSVTPFVAYLSESETLSDEDLAELERLVGRLQGRRRLS